jgi:hypothetical protein
LQPSHSSLLTKYTGRSRNKALRNKEQSFKGYTGAGDWSWRLEAGGWRLETRGWRLEAGDWSWRLGQVQSLSHDMLHLKTLT